MLSSKAVTVASTVDPNAAQSGSASEGSVDQLPLSNNNGAAAPAMWSSTRQLDSAMTPKLESLGDFLATHPESDGRGVTIAILDTGIDPRLEGMQVTSTGDRKLIHLADCSGAGDIDCSHVATASDGVITGLTGRKLDVFSIKDAMNPSGIFYLGIKPIEELYPEELQAIMKEHYRPEWEAASNMASAQSRRLLASHINEVGETSANRFDRLKRQDLATRVDILKETFTTDPTWPVADVLMWHDGKSYKAMLDTSFNGKLAQCRAMGSYAESGECGVDIIKGDQLSYTFNIHGDEKIVEIVVACGSHGSHVASIAAANYPSNPNLNGLAPGAKLISLCICDSRIGKVPTGTALTRAFDICRRMKVDVINMSLGDDVDFTNSGRIIDELRKLLADGRSLFFAAPGNEGPARTSVCCPGGTTAGVIGVGALLLPDQLPQLYGNANNIAQPTPFYWSSCGPSPDGAAGVSIYAPGGAFAETARFSQTCSTLKSGTSMSSPNAAGAAACLVSRIRQGGHDFSPYEIRLAMEHGAKKVDGCMAGMLFIPDAYKCLLAFSSAPLKLWDVKVNATRWGLTNSQRGIYMREASEFATTPHVYNVIVEPLFTKSATPHEETNFHLPLRLEVQDGNSTTKPPIKIEVPSVFNLSSGVNSFPVRLAYKEGVANQEVNYCGWISAVDSVGRSVFRIPFCIIRPLSTTHFSMSLSTERVERRLIMVPEGRNVACITFKSTSLSTNTRVVFRAVQNIPGHAAHSHELAKDFDIDKVSRMFMMNLVPGRSLELCSTLHTLSYTTVDANVHVDFYNILHDPVLHMTTSSSCNQFSIETVSGIPFECDPAIALKCLVKYYKPSEIKLEPLGARDFFIDGLQIHRLLLTYNIYIGKGAECQLELGGISEYLYESPYDDLFIQIFSPRKEFVGASSSFRDQHAVRLERGEYKVVVQVRHPDNSALEKLKDSTLSVYHKLPSHINLDCYSTGTMDEKWSKQMLAPTQRATVYVQSVTEELGAAGTSFLGTCVPFAGNDEMTYTIPIVLRNESGPSYVSDRPPEVELLNYQEEKDSKERLADALRDLAINFIGKAGSLNEVRQLYRKAKTDIYYLPLELVLYKKLFALLRSSTTEVDDSVKIEKMLLALGQQIIDYCEPKEILAYFGTENRDEYLSLSDKKCSMIEKKMAIVEVYASQVTLFAEKQAAKLDKAHIPRTYLETLRKRHPLCESDGASDGASNAAASTSDKLEKSFTKLQAFVKYDDDKMHVLNAKYAMAKQLHAIAFRAVEKHIADSRASNKPMELDERVLSELACLCGWDHLARSYHNDYLHMVRPTFRPF